MSKKVLIALSVLFASNVASAESGYTPDPLEEAPEGKVECSWSSMKKDEYEECMKRRSFFEKMSAEEKAEYNKDVSKRRTEERLRSLERRVDMLERGRR